MLPVLCCCSRGTPGVGSSHLLMWVQLPVTVVPTKVQYNIVQYCTVTYSTLSYSNLKVTDLPSCKMQAIRLLLPAQPGILAPRHAFLAGWGMHRPRLDAAHAGVRAI